MSLAQTDQGYPPPIEHVAVPDLVKQETGYYLVLSLPVYLSLSLPVSVSHSPSPLPHPPIIPHPFIIHSHFHLSSFSPSLHHYL